MTRLIALATCLLITFSAAACGGSTSPTPGATDSPLKQIKSAQQAIDLATQSAGPFFASDPIDVNAIHMTARDAARETQDMGLDAVPHIQQSNYSGCPKGAACPYPGEPADEPGYLVLITGTPLAQNPTQSPNSEEEFQASWISDGGGIVGAPPAYPAPAGPPDGSYVAIYPTDWGIMDPSALSESQTSFQISIAAGGGCDKFDRIDTTETSDAVSVRAFYRETTHPDTAVHSSSRCNRWTYISTLRLATESSKAATARQSVMKRNQALLPTAARPGNKTPFGRR